LAGAEGGDAGIHGIGIATLVGGNDLVIFLGGVEVVRQLDNKIVVGPRHGVPPLDLGLCRRRAGDGAK
jgi:hypothetical protein